MLGKLLGKKSGYFLELSEEEIDSIPGAPATSASVAPAASQESPKAKAAPAAAKPAASKPAKQASVPAAPAPTASISDPIELIRTALASSANQPPAPEPEPEPTFDYTTPVAKASRRRPGPSMASFKTMAKDMRKTASGF